MMSSDDSPTKEKAPVLDIFADFNSPQANKKQAQVVDVSASTQKEPPTREQLEAEFEKR